MLVFLDADLVFLAVPKTGTTAVEMALRPRADIAFMRGRKHMTAQRYRNKVAPFLASTFDTAPETVAVMRAPIEQIRSWYRYRSGPRQKGGPRSTDGRSFDAFVRAVIQPEPPEFAAIGSQFNFLTDGKGRLLVDHLFAYEAQQAFRTFLQDRLGGGEIEFKQKNVSPHAETPLSPQAEAELRAARADEFELYDRITAAGGHLRAG